MFGMGVSKGSAIGRGSDGARRAQFGMHYDRPTGIGVIAPQRGRPFVGRQAQGGVATTDGRLARLCSPVVRTVDPSTGTRGHLSGRYEPLRMMSAMASREGPDRQAIERARERIGRAIAEIRRARIDRGMTQLTVARRVGISRARVGRIELDSERHVPAELLVRMASVVGLDLAVRCYPGPDPALDAPQRRLLQRFASSLGPGWRYRTEVPLPIIGDKRAWDSVAAHRASGLVVHVEAESRLGDVQALLRRLALKRRDGAARRMVLVVADTRQNRTVVGAAAADLLAMFPADHRVALSGLREGRDPGADVMVLL